VSATTVEKALDVLFHLHAAAAPRGVTELGRALGLPKSSAHRLLRALRSRALVEQDAQGRYRPGVGLLALGVGVLERDPLVAAARPVLEEESERLGETLFLAAARAGQIRVLDKSEGPSFLRAAPNLGSTVPVHATAVGKLYLAFAPEEVNHDGSEDRFTPRTRSGRSLEREIRLARRRGWADNREEWMRGLAAVAAPLRVGERLVGALALAAPSARLRAADVPRLAARVVDAAARINARLEGRST
jgi:IclR family acetate operon transcriptional repressor